ncbi:hypothetical protein BDZ89DRAFT_664616 [Hymenopellis radicata]|nr:hypothetical protein BDZ89DRAFT_664616 [Hymenopellis radicata]
MDDRPPPSSLVLYTPSLSVTYLTLDPSVWRSCYWTTSFSQYLKKISLPQLQDLTLVGHEHLFSRDPDDPVLVLQIANLINRSKCTLTAFRLIMNSSPRTIRVRNIIASSDDLNALLVVTPKLRTLHVIESAPILLDRRFFKRLNKRTFLPCLTDVKFVWMPRWCAQAVIEPLVQTLLVKFLATRVLLAGGSPGSKNAVASLSSVVLGLRLGAEAPEGVVWCLQKLREEGVDAWLW